jgi:hypothetical protein
MWLHVELVIIAMDRLCDRGPLHVTTLQRIAPNEAPKLMLKIKRSYPFHMFQLLREVSPARR